jgi:protein-disulfide isomerase
LRAAGRFWAYHDYLYVRQPEWAGAVVPDSVWVAYAESLGLEPQEFAGCLEAPETLAAVESDLREALDSGATGTPTIVLGGRSLVGFDSYGELRAEILAAIENAQH